jgi:hypothetical protein
MPGNNKKLKEEEEKRKLRDRVQEMMSLETSQRRSISSTQHLLEEVAKRRSRRMMKSMKEVMRLRLTLNYFKMMGLSQNQLQLQYPQTKFKLT